MTSRLVAICALLTMVPSEATADWIVRPFFGAAVSPRHGFVDLEQTSGDSKLVWGAATGWHPRAIGVEFELSVLPGFFNGPGDLIIAGNVTTDTGTVAIADAARVVATARERRGRRRYRPHPFR